MFHTSKKMKLDILVYGFESEKDKMQNILSQLQTQLDALKRDDVGVAFGLGQSDPDNTDEIKQNLRKMSNSEFFLYLFANDNEVLSPTYLQGLLRAIEEEDDDKRKYLVSSIGIFEGK